MFGGFYPPLGRLGSPSWTFWNFHHVFLQKVFFVSPLWDNCRCHVQQKFSVFFLLKRITPRVGSFLHRGGGDLNSLFRYSPSVPSKYQHRLCQQDGFLPIPKCLGETWSFRARLRPNQWWYSNDIIFPWKSFAFSSITGQLVLFWSPLICRN